MTAVCQSEFAKLAGVSRQQISLMCKSGALVIRPDKKLDPSNPVNQDYIRAKQAQKQPDSDEGTSGKDTKITSGKSSSGRARANNFQENKRNLNIRDYGEDPDISDFDLSDQIGGIQLSFLSRSNADRLKVIEQIRQIQIKTEKERNELISRELVKTIFAKIYTIDVNELQTLGLTLAPDLAAMAGIDDTETILKFSERIEKETYKVLQHIKRLLNNFLKSIEAETIPDDTIPEQ